MAIKGMTDQQEALPRIGELRKGDIKTGNKPGADLSYFRFTSDDDQANELFFNSYPDEPRQINIFLPHQTAEDNFDSWIEKWVAGGLVYRSDGESLVLYQNAGQFFDVPIPDTYTELLSNGKRKDGGSEVGRLSVIIPELGRIATVTALTTSKWDIINITRQLKAYESFNGDLRGIPFVLKRTKKKISTPGKNGKRLRREIWLLSIETKPEWSMAKLLQDENMSFPQLPDDTTITPVVIEQLPTPVDVSPFEETSEETSAPAKQKPAPPKDNGNKPAQKAPAPTNPIELMELCNDKLGTDYKSIVHLLNAIKKQSGIEDYAWPAREAVEGWKFAYKQVTDYQETKEKADQVADSLLEPELFPDAAQQTAYSTDT